MRNINNLSDDILTVYQKSYINRINEGNEASVFPDKTLRKLLDIIDELAIKLNEYRINDDKNRLL